jgi:hypothetical protein
MTLDKTIDSLEQCFEAKPINLTKVKEVLDYVNTLFPPYDSQEFEEIFNYLVYFSISEQNIELIKLIYHPIFDNIESLKENIKTHVAHEVVEQKKYDFIAPTVLSGIVSMENYTFEAVNLGNMALCQYIMNHPQLEFDLPYLKEHYHHLFYQDDLDIAFLLKDKINVDNHVIQDCLREALTLDNSKNIEYLLNHYPDKTISEINQWFGYILRGGNILKKNNLLNNDESVGISSVATMSYVIDLYKKHNQESFNTQKENLINVFFLKEFLEYKPQQVMAFLDYAYLTKEETLPTEIMQYIVHYRDHHSRRVFENFPILWEKHCLEFLSTSKDTLALSKKIKL